MKKNLTKAMDAANKDKVRKKDECTAKRCDTCMSLTQDPTYDSLPTYCDCEESENYLDWKDSPEDLADCCKCWEKRIGKIKCEPIE